MPRGPFARQAGWAPLLSLVERTVLDREFKTMISARSPRRALVGDPTMLESLEQPDGGDVDARREPSL